MPSLLHAVLVDLLAAHPEALAYLLELAGIPPSGPLLPAPDTKVRAVALERRVDRVFLVGSPRAPRGFTLVEVQIEPDDDKRFAWPLYVEMARSRYRCEGALVVLTVTEAVRRWIARDIVPATGQYGGARQMTPVVLALDQIDPPLLLRPDRPYLARLAVAARALAADTARIAREAVRITVERLPDRLATEQLDAILGLVDEALRAELEASLMEHPRFKSETFRRWYAQATAEGRADGLAKGLEEGLQKGLQKGLEKGLQKGIQEGLQKGLQEGIQKGLQKGLQKGIQKGIQEGIQEGIQKGREKGEAQGKAEGILVVLAARGIAVSDAQRARILACTDPVTLDQWLRRAAVLSSTAAVLRAPGQAASPGRKASRRRPSR